ncbi:DUF4339 domain-containing protein [Prosthecobacter vanneervenii]|uniref:GYF domain-containing protein n=1 Tax=Prosthecobacter vanneervenii TaxID=48466 RepID=A0A7W7YBB6_9BACT|nr:DUF4339 domain-containing protein [Prosthecobacter vanneervenii]MBB5032965.1 hypothetical protein [Prosthecobacter vanneervenii]
MSEYLITREGKEVGTYTLPQIQDGLRSGHLQPTDWGWQEGMEDWKVLADIAGPALPPPGGLPKPANAISSPLSAPIKRMDVRAPDGVNPYAAPVANIDITGTGGSVPPLVVLELKGTRFWVRLISIFMWLGVLAMVGVCVINILFSGAIAQASGATSLGSAYVMGTTVGYGLMTLLFLYPTLRLTKYASRITSLVRTRSYLDLTQALSEQRRFWKFYGVIALIYISCVVLAVVVALVFMPKNFKLPTPGGGSAPSAQQSMDLPAR